MDQDSDPKDRPPPLGTRVYANDLLVDFSLSEFHLDFAQNYGAEDVHLQSRLVTSPTVMAEFHQTMDAALAAYEKRYGQIPKRSDDGKD